MLRKLLRFVNIKIFRIVYFAHFYSQITYGIVFWGFIFISGKCFHKSKKQQIELC